MTDEQVTPGERIVTSGGDQIFPKGLPVGTVMKVSPGADLFLNIRVKPSANLSRLEEVLVITKERGSRASVAETNSVRAVDILTQRLPSVPDKPRRMRASRPHLRAPPHPSGRRGSRTSPPAFQPSLRVVKPVDRAKTLRTADRQCRQRQRLRRSGVISQAAHVVEPRNGSCSRAIQARISRATSLSSPEDKPH